MTLPDELLVVWRRFYVSKYLKRIWGNESFQNSISLQRLRQLNWHGQKPTSRPPRLTTSFESEKPHHVVGFWWFIQHMELANVCTMSTNIWNTLYYHLLWSAEVFYFLMCFYGDGLPKGPNAMGCKRFALTSLALAARRRRSWLRCKRSNSKRSSSERALDWGTGEGRHP